MDWTKAETVTCPDCGYAFGFRTAAGSLNLTFDPKTLRARCKRVPDPDASAIACPRFDEVTREADRSERVDPESRDRES